MPYILFLAYSINEPFENKIKKYYIRKTTEKLKNADVIKIGITGSFAKTSVKEILKTILSQKYRVLSTFGSYNTPMGISLTTKKLDNTYDIFIAEMGARYKGDIKVLADMVNPTYCVLTGINVQHLETFKSEENIKDTKFELFDNPNKNKIGFFACNTEGSMELFNRFDGEKYLGGIGNEDALAYATDITVSSTGTEFNLNIKGEKPVACKTVLLGRHSIKNICLASAVAYKIGLTPEEISIGINRLSSIEHRLELVPNNKNMVIIDDSYNSNVDGTKSAMEVLDSFSGRKIVVTPGLVELGKIENVANAEFGRILAKHADIVIVVGKHNAETIINGLIDGGMDRRNIIFAKNLKKGNEELNAILSKGDVVLFENDLPDNYN
jgi:UDP-N-acetylmuramoyl-tripeptide--D-alanyl-D-alanine ligase